MSDEKYISVDIEAVGLIVGDYSMASIGACMINNQSDTFYAELKPINDNYRQESCDVCGFTIDYLKEHGQEVESAMKHFAEWIDSHGRCIMVGFNLPFDYQFINHYFLKYLGRNPFGINGIDIKAYYMGMLNKEWRETTKKHLLPQFKSNKKHTHNALDDAVEQAQIFEKMLAFNRNKI